ncbi:lysophospholipid acyltransferase family protein [Limobrevibacterium gyesilva]|uniref:1-acyl-sn-glycerol-3-phosphate acyltransferase n=1 Tax=Limobrevibacterium gyesilva TaxID=2991712 RepID=A0AA41YRZ2_9PROT|nr:lysophospholipid acyltransferase family protein [Limobrevibacterium gyesilva]MCW3477765.1 1-acyl-sn-glycerol-3-phosphate acyltransferase [Limobrevibacterium gyesilva]
MILLRSIVFNAWFYGATLVFVLYSLVPRMFTRGLTPRWALNLARLWARTVLFGLRHLCGTRWAVTGREHLPTGGPALIASMHQSAFDTMVWLLLVPRPCYVLKKELLRIPVFGTLSQLAGMIAVDRGAGANAIRSLLREGDRAVAEERQIVIFPEGTRVAPGQQARLHAGIAALAARTGLPVIPVATDSGFCWGRRAFRKRPGVIHVAVGAPIPPGLPREEVMRRLEQAFADGAAALDAPTGVRVQAVDNSVG